MLINQLRFALEQDVSLMAKLTAPAILSILVALLGVFFFIGAVSGLLFAEATAFTDIGAWTVLIVFLAIGLLGLWASTAEDKQRLRDQRRH